MSCRRHFRSIAAALAAARLLAACVSVLGAGVEGRKAPVPDETKRARVMAMVEEVYGKELAAATSVEDKTALVKKLLAAADVAGENPVDRYALLERARLLAAETGADTTALDIVEVTAREYRVDRPALKADTVRRLAAGVTEAPNAERVARAAIVELPRWIAEGRFDAAGEAARAAVEASAQCDDAALRKRAISWETAVKEAPARRSEYEAAEKELQQQADDPGANTTAGRYLCLVLGDWEKGLPRLAKGTDPSLGQLAGRELRPPTIAAEQFALGTAWWSAAQAAESPAHEQMLRRAGAWYRTVQPELTDTLNDALVNRRLQTLAAAGIRVQPIAAVTPDPDRPLSDEQWNRLFGQHSLLVLTFERKIHYNYKYPDLSGRGQEVRELSEANFAKKGKAGRGLKLPDGRRAYVDLETLRDDLVKDLRSLSICFWMDHHMAGKTGVLFTVGTYPDAAVRVSIQGGRSLEFSLPRAHGGGACAAALPKSSGWHHVVCNWNGTDQAIYFDGKLAAKAPTGALLLDDRSVAKRRARIGWSAGRNLDYFDGLLDELAVFRRALTEQEIRAIHARGLQGKNLVADK